MIYNRLSDITNTGFPLTPQNLRWEGGTGTFVHKLMNNIIETKNAQLITGQPASEIRGKPLCCCRNITKCNTKY
jgi:hypothetical protein